MLCKIFVNLTDTSTPNSAGENSQKIVWHEHTNPHKLQLNS